MLRYRESLGLLPVVRVRPARRRRPLLGQPQPSGHPGLAGPASQNDPVRHRQFSQADIDAVALGLAIEQRYDISPAALAFGLRVLTDPAARTAVADLGRRIGRIRPLPVMAMDFEKERAIRLLANPAGGRHVRGDHGRADHVAGDQARRVRGPAPGTSGG